jgi:F420-dependent oxidoreductase-like protein
MRVCLMIEGQEDVGWDDWVGLAATCEESGLEGLFRSDHYLSVMGQAGRGSLDAWATISALAALTRRIRLGTLVSPATFRHPSVLAKMAVTADHVSGGRVELGLGAGWLEPEHRAYGFEFPPTAVRMEVLAEQLEIVHRSWSEEEFSFEGRHYTVAGLDALPKPVQRPHPPLILGGHAGRRSVELAARWADEYNTIFVSPDECGRRRQRVKEAFEEAGRPPSGLRFSLMTGCIVGEDARAVERRAALVMERTGETGDVAAWIAARAEQWAIGTADQVAERLGELAAAGVDRVMLQDLLHRDLDMVRLLGSEVAPKVA